MRGWIKHPNASRATPLTPDAASFLVSEARLAAGSRSKLSTITGIARARLRSIETGRREQSRRMTLTYAERYLLETIIRIRRSMS